ncbi:MAG: hypothetical protein P8013_13095 [Candidatus Sulfobium sp.]|jgi:hypothetical protein
MALKRPNWNKCETHGIIQKWPTAKPLSFDAPVIAGMEVSAQYGDSTVFLKITKALKENDFEAEIRFFEPINIAPPKDLKEGEIVLIDREHICWLHPKEAK